MGSRNFTVLAVLVAAVFWISDSIIHYFVYEELQFEIVPSDFNELWMRILIFLLIIGAGVYIDYATKKRIEAADEVKKKYVDELNKIRKEFSNLVDRAQDFELETSKSSAMDKTILACFTNSIHAARTHLEDVGDMTAENIKLPVDKKS